MLDAQFQTFCFVNDFVQIVQFRSISFKSFNFLSFAGVLVYPDPMRAERLSFAPNYDTTYAMAPYPEPVYSSPDFGHMSAQQLHDLAQRQQQQLQYQQEILAQKRKQLNYIHYWDQCYKTFYGRNFSNFHCKLGCLSQAGLSSLV